MPDLLPMHHMYISSIEFFCSFGFFSLKDKKIANSSWFSVFFRHVKYVFDLKFKEIYVSMLHRQKMRHLEEAGNSKPSVFCSHGREEIRPKHKYHQGKELFVSTNELFRTFLRVTSSDRGRPRERILLFLAVVQSEEETL